MTPMLTLLLAAVNWTDVFTPNALVAIGLGAIIIIGLTILRVMNWGRDLFLNSLKDHIQKINAMADLVPDIKKDLDSLTTEAKEMKAEVSGLRDDIRKETDAKLLAQIEKDAHLDTRLQRIEKHNLHDLRQYLQGIVNNVESLGSYVNQLTVLSDVKLAPFVIRMPVLRSVQDRRRYDYTGIVDPPED